MVDYILGVTDPKQWHTENINAVNLRVATAAALLLSPAEVSEISST